MRILMYSDFYGTLTTTFIRNEVHAVAKNEELLYLTGKVLKSDEGVVIYELPFEQTFLQKKIRWILWKYDLLATFTNKNFAEKLNRKLKNFSPDILHLHFGFEGLKILQNLEQKYPVLLHFHGYDASQMLRKSCYVKQLRKYLSQDHVNCIVVSDFMKHQLAAHGIDMSRAHLMRYGIDMNAFVPSQVSEKKDGEFVFLQVSSLAEKKGHVYVLRALKKLFDLHPGLRSRIKVQFTGDGPEKAGLEKMARNLSVQDAVEFLGNCNKEKVIGLLGKADVFIHHSITDSKGDMEGIPNSLMEAMAMQLPVLSTYHAGIPELVKHGVNGLLCNEKDCDTLAKQMFDMLEWKKLPENRSVVEAHYNMEKHNVRLMEIYRSEIERSKH